MEEVFRKFPALESIFSEHGINQEVLEVCSFEDIQSLLTPLNLGEKLIFKSMFLQRKAPSPSISIEIDSEVSDADLKRCFPGSEDSVSTENLFEDKQTVEETVPQETSVQDPTESIPNRTEPAADYLLPARCSDFEVFKARLSASIEGQCILNHQSKFNSLDNTHRNRLTRLIITNELSVDPSVKLPCIRFLALREFIGRLFPQEDLDIWYTPYTSIAQKRQCNAKGKLVAFYHNYRKHLIKDGVIAKAGRSASTSSNCDETLDEATAEKLSLLQKASIGCVPFETSYQNWKQTFKPRQKNLAKEEPSIQKYFETFPLLTRDTGLKLLLSDYDDLHPNTNNRLFDEWISFKENLLTYAKTRCIKDVAFKNLLEHFSIVLDETDDDLSNIHTFRILGLLLSNIKKFQKGWKPDKEDAVDGVLLLVQSSADFQNVLNTKFKRNEKYQFPQQPVPIVIFDAATRRCSSQVYINGNSYTCDSPIKAVDACFKCFQALHAQYPVQSKIAWQFLQVYIYKVKTAYDETSLKACNLAENLKISK